MKGETMATRRNPRFKECRRLGTNVYGHPKAMNRTSTAVTRRKKQSEYGLQLTEKQKVKAYHGILERQMRRYFEEARRKPGKTGDILLETLECRLDNIVYRLGFGSSIRQARQMVNHGHILVNGKKVDIPSYRVNPGDTVALTEKAAKNEMFRENFLEREGFTLPYLEKDRDSLVGTLTRMPAREEIPVEVEDQLVVELYSK